MRAVVTEKASVARDLARVLGADRAVDAGLEGQGWLVTWLNGHVAELAEPGEMRAEWRRWRLEALPMLPRPIPWRVTSSGRARFSAVRTALEDPRVERVVCATDAGREGELIFRVVAELVGLAKPVDRLWISSLTADAIRGGLAALRPLATFDPLGRAALGRAWVDWWVGMNASRALTLTHGEPLTAGRVQTPTLALVVARDRERRDFVPRPFATLVARFRTPEGRTLEAQLTGEADPLDPAARRFEVEDPRLPALVEALPGAGAVARARAGRPRLLPPPELHDLDLLQADAHAALGFTAARTLEVAQRLYERHKLITYPRTDSRKLDPDTARTLTERFSAPPPGDADLARHVDAGAVRDHHAILPTGLAPPPDLDADAAALFRLVEARLPAAHGPAARVVAEHVVIEAGAACFVAEGLRLEDEGWTRFEPGSRPPEAPLPDDVAVGVSLEVVDAELRQGATSAPARLDDAALVRRMAELGLGTPATRADTLEALIERGYLQRPPDAATQLESTPRGQRSIALAPPVLTTPELTADIEAALGEVAADRLSLDAFVARAEQLVTDLVAAIARSRSAVDAERGAHIEGIESERALPGAGEVHPELDALLREGASLPAVEALEPDVETDLSVSFGSPWVLFRHALLAGGPGTGARVIASPAPPGLLDDEVMELRGLGLRADRLHPGRSDEAARDTCRRYLAGALDVLFVHAETIGRPGLAAMLAQGRPRALVVDDAGRASRWHPASRPELAAVAQLSGSRRVALFAATPKVMARDALERLGLGAAETVVVPWSSRGLALERVPVPPAARARLLRACVDDAPGSTLVVTRDGRRAEALADDLGAEAHHDRRSPATRRAARRRFQSGEASVLVVTDDFPPRVELPALRRLVFDGPPPDLTQLSAWVLGPAVLEEEVRAVVLHDPKDLEAHAERLERAAPPVAALDLVGRRLRAAPASLDALARASGLEGPVVARYLEALVAAGGAVREGEGAVRGAPDWKDRHAGRVRRLRAGLSAVERWLRASGCRIAALAQAAGQPHEPECGLCDACDPDGALVPLRPPSAEERQRMQDMLRAMARSGPIPEGALFRGLQGPGLETRRAFERLLDALEGAGAVAREAESRRGQAVWMIRLTEQGRAPGALRLARVRDPQGSWKG